MENNEVISGTTEKPVEKAGLSILALILMIVGNLMIVFHCLTLFKPFVEAAGDWVPTFTTNAILYWIIFGIGALLVITASSIGQYLTKRGLGIKSVNKAVGLLVWVFIILVVVSIIFMWV